MNWAAQDWRTSRIRLRSIRTRDHWLRIVYLEILFALPENNGSIPADPEQLEDLLGIPAEVIRPRLAVLERFATDDANGGIVVANGRITNRRVTREMHEKREFIESQRIKGKRSGESRAIKPRRSRTRTAVEQRLNSGSTVVEPLFNSGSTTVEPIPTPIPTPSPSPLPEKTSQVEDPLAGAPGGANGGPKKPLNAQAQRVKNVEDISFHQRGVEPPPPGAIATWLTMVDELEIESIVESLEGSGKLRTFATPKELSAYLFGCVKREHAERVALELKTGGRA